MGRLDLAFHTASLISVSILRQQGIEKLSLCKEHPTVSHLTPPIECILQSKQTGFRQSSSFIFLFLDLLKEAKSQFTD